ncbi:MAG: hypothetical protein DRG30_07690 [Epsilonproteobacteria bacterium]|nr:MAG: hypothetical protein DRG30_07690 [Campylobacterota bacterium]
MEAATPPFEITAAITDLLVKIGGELVRLEGLSHGGLESHLRWANRIAAAVNSPQRSVERALQRLKRQNRIIFTGAPKTGGYTPFAGTKP